jgi:predicted ABC-type ATPase
LSRRKEPPPLVSLLDQAVRGTAKPVAFVLAGHNGSGKSTLWRARLSERLQIPLVNADRLTASILPDRDPETGKLPGWAQQLRDDDERWQRLSQDAVNAMVHLVMAKRLPFATETVFSHWEPRGDGTYASKADLIKELQAQGYFVVLLFVGLAVASISALRVSQRLREGGHGVPLAKIEQRFPRTQKAIGHAAPIADMAIMFDNSLDETKGFTLVRVQQGEKVLFDCRDVSYYFDNSVRLVAGIWLRKVAGRFDDPNPSSKKSAPTAAKKK